MSIFSGKLTRGQYAGRWFASMVICFALMFGLVFVSENMKLISYNLTMNILLPMLFLGLLVYWLGISARRLRDIGVTPWLTIVVAFFSPISNGVLMAIPSK